MAYAPDGIARRVRGRRNIAETVPDGIALRAWGRRVGQEFTPPEGFTGYAPDGIARRTWGRRNTAQQVPDGLALRSRGRLVGYEVSEPAAGDVPFNSSFSVTAIATPTRGKYSLTVNFSASENILYDLIIQRGALSEIARQIGNETEIIQQSGS